jgi:hypothetical protein
MVWALDCTEKAPEATTALSIRVIPAHPTTPPPTSVTLAMKARIRLRMEFSLAARSALKSVISISFIVQDYEGERPAAL